MQFETDISSPHAELFQATRTLLIEVHGLEEIKKPRITTYAHKSGNICHMRTMPHGVDFGFLKGAKMEDKLGLLIGNGKAMRVLPMGEVDASTVAYYVEQAIGLNGG
ncbi:MAG: DUF1801 domain-containing protein [Rhizobiaceae bacterium]